MTACHFHKFSPELGQAWNMAWDKLMLYGTDNNWTCNAAQQTYRRGQQKPNKFLYNDGACDRSFLVL